MASDVVPDDYATLLAALKNEVRTAQLRAHRVVNTELLELYWSIGDQPSAPTARRGLGRRSDSAAR